jgi:hypothetical protein
MTYKPLSDEELAKPEIGINYLRRMAALQEQCKLGNALAEAVYKHLFDGDSSGLIPTWKAYVGEDEDV